MSQKDFTFELCRHISIVQNVTYTVRAGSKAAARRILNRGKPTAEMTTNKTFTKKPIVGIVSCKFVREASAPCETATILDIFDDTISCGTTNAAIAEQSMPVIVK